MFSVGIKFTKKKIIVWSFEHVGCAQFLGLAEQQISQRRTANKQRKR